jgi:hypothetical protein
MAEEKAMTCKMNLDITTEKLETILGKLPTGLSGSVRIGQFTGAWLTVLPSIINDGSVEKFCDVICYGELPSSFPQKCDHCDTHLPFSMLLHAKGEVLSSLGTMKCKTS